MFERFTNRARHTVVLAQEEARRLQHNYIGTEHILLGLLGEPDGVAGRVLTGFGISRDGVREEVAAAVGLGKATRSGHIPFTPRAKKTLELALREALQLHHNYIGTEHILLGVIREGDGVAAKILAQHADLLKIRMALLDSCPPGQSQASRGRRWLRRRGDNAPLGPSGAGEDPEFEQHTGDISATPAADTTLSEAARLAGAQPVGSHHLLLAALADLNSAAAKTLSTLGLNLDQVKEALRQADVTGTSDEQPEEAGRRQMRIQVHDDRVVVEATDPAIIETGRATMAALAGQEPGDGTIHGDQPGSASLSNLWQALHDSLETIQRRAAAENPGSDQGGSDEPVPRDQAS